MSFQKALFAFVVIHLINFPVTGGDDLSIVRENVRLIMLWPTTDEVNDVIAQAIGNLSTLDRNTCRWPDLDYETRGAENWDPVLHMFRLSTMTAAFTVPNGLANDSELCSAIHCGLKVWID